MCVQSDCNCNRHSPGMWMYLTMSVEIKLCGRSMPPGICLIFFLAPLLFVDIEFCYLVKCMIFFFLLGRTPLACTVITEFCTDVWTFKGNWM